ncbi:Putative protein [Zobellia galactanivorans]|uniref:Uncharacterized protein n=1 Tax=Zobellia galactanivorans (strain DSM 12802 / CCUG 47099 / CIP 106680 / NCIMB 13871 / Dsij) TaxID=63186 RepID=G0KZS2_ZOBGA|nr:Putative protein [Zobellia galactanivorans]
MPWLFFYTLFIPLYSSLKNFQQIPSQTHKSFLLIFNILTISPLTFSI